MDKPVNFSNSFIIIKDGLFTSTFIIKFRDISTRHECLAASSCKYDNPYALIFSKVIKYIFGSIPHIQGNRIMPFWIIENHPADAILLFG